MKLSQLIYHLQECLKENGDLGVNVQVDYDYDHVVANPECGVYEIGSDVPLYFYPEMYADKINELVISTSEKDDI